jgi:hypothetical protein
MKLTRTNKVAKAMLLGVILLVALPALSFAQGRGRGRGLDKKAEKFINGHDARDGRWDGRGPNRNRSDYFRSRRWRDRDDDFRFGRNRRVDRDGDGDFDRNDVLLGRQRRVDWDGDGDFDRFDVLQRQRQLRFQRFERRDRRLDWRFDQRRWR